MEEIIKDKEEIQEFLKNIGIEYRFSCYSEKNPQGCQLLADYLSQIDNDYKKANIVLKDNCDTRNYGRSCSCYGQNLLNGKGCPKDYETALKYFVKACELDDANGCDFAGKIYAGFEPLLQKKIKPDYKQGLRYLLHGCNINSTAHLFESSESCYAAAFMYASGIKDVLPKDYQKAIELGTKSCEMGQMKACKLVSNVYKQLENEKMSKFFMNQYIKLQKQVTDNIEIKMQRS